jgi:hypothetical protein
MGDYFPSVPPPEAISENALYLPKIIGTRQDLRAGFYLTGVIKARFIPLKNK